MSKMLRTLADIGEVLLLAGVLFIGIPALLYVTLIASVIWR